MASKKAVGKGKTPAKGSFKKGQAMMEYLMTYGLALFIIVVVIGILVAVVLPMLNPPDSCSFTQAGFGCKKVMIADKTSTNTRSIVELSNEQGRGVKIFYVLCTESAIGNIDKTTVETNTYSWKSVNTVDGDKIAAGGTMTVGNDAVKKLYCIKQDGTVVQLAVNSNFKGTLAVEYAFDDDVTGAPHRIATATITGPVVGE